MDGILADLGISSHQIDTPSRGFATRFDGPLDMRMTAKQKFTAAFLLNTYPEDKLYDIFSLYGEVSNAHLLAKTIVQARVEPLQTIGELKTAIKSCMPAGFEHKYLAKVFQAIRIELNDELGALKLLLTQATEVLKPGGRLVVISYHSLEDRLVKNFMKTGNFNGDPQKDFYGNLLAPFTPVTRKPIVPSASELNTNPRSRSARLRIASKN
jgi:16S rRNA (cytosine1402-N4)-methyltransferase